MHVVASWSCPRFASSVCLLWDNTQCVISLLHSGTAPFDHLRASQLLMDDIDIGTTTRLSYKNTSQKIMRHALANCIHLYTIQVHSTCKEKGERGAFICGTSCHQLALGQKKPIARVSRLMANRLVFCLLQLASSFCFTGNSLHWVDFVGQKTIARCTNLSLFVSDAHFAHKH